MPLPGATTYSVESFRGSWAIITTREATPAGPRKDHEPCAKSEGWKTNVRYKNSRARRLMNCRKRCIIGRTGCSSGSNDDRQAVAFYPISGNVEIDLINTNPIWRQTRKEDRVLVAA